MCLVHLETYSCKWQFILHTHPHTNCSQCTQGRRYTHPLTDGSHTHPLMNFYSCTHPLLKRFNFNEWNVQPTPIVSRHKDFSVRVGANRFIKDFKNECDFIPSQFNCPHMCFYLNQTDLHPASSPLLWLKGRQMHNWTFLQQKTKHMFRKRCRHTVTHSKRWRVTHPWTFLAHYSNMPISNSSELQNVMFLLSFCYLPKIAGLSAQADSLPHLAGPTMILVFGISSSNMATEAQSCLWARLQHN